MSTFLRTLEEEWGKGRLKELEADLEQFLRKHASEIRSAIRNRDHTMIRVVGRLHDHGKLDDQEMIDLCVRSILRRCGTVNPRKDIEEQAREISKEIWFEGERICGPVSAQRQEEIARMWAHLHATKWREWRLREILFTWEKKLPDFLRIILERSTTERRPPPERETTSKRARKGE